MSSVEEARHSLYSRLEEVLGPEDADTLMTYLSTHAAGELATKGDIARLEDRFDRFEERFDHLQRTIIVAMVGSMTALTAIFSLMLTFFG